MKTAPDGTAFALPMCVVRLQPVVAGRKIVAMFANAYERGCRFTRPVVTFWHRTDGLCRTGVGSLIVLNKEGWFLSAAHIWNGLGGLNQAVDTARAHQAKVAAVHANASLNRGQRKNALASLGHLPDDAPLAWAVRWINDGVRAMDVATLDQADLMIGRLDPFDPASVPEYPKLKDPVSAMKPGTSLCRLGYPFPNVEATYDQKSNRFDIAKMELPFFPIEGIFTRNVFIGPNPSGYRNLFIETSSPGLKGQSGGPILDVNGIVWGVQSNTQSFSLGFDPVVPAEDGKKAGGRKEHQFLNVGWATHPETIVGFLKDKKVQFAVAP